MKREVRLPPMAGMYYIAPSGTIVNPIGHNLIYICATSPRERALCASEEARGDEGRVYHTLDDVVERIEPGAVEAVMEMCAAYIWKKDGDLKYVLPYMAIYAELYDIMEPRSPRYNKGRILKQGGVNMLTKDNLKTVLLDALKALNGSATIVEVCRYVWDTYEKELIESGNLFYTWQYDIRWAATELRKDRKMKDADISDRGLWELA